MKKKRVLVIEDNLMNMELVTDVLEVAGYTVLQAANAEEGIELAREELPDIILMDISLPLMDGLEATALLKQDAKTSSIPVVAITAHAMKDDRERIIAAGCQGYITKPIDVKTFAEQIAQHLD